MRKRGERRTHRVQAHRADPTRWEKFLSVVEALGNMLRVSGPLKMEDWLAKLAIFVGFPWGVPIGIALREEDVTFHDAVITGSVLFVLTLGTALCGLLLKDKVIIGEDGFALHRKHSREFYSFTNLGRHWWQTNTFFVSANTSTAAEAVIAKWESVCGRPGYPDPPLRFGGLDSQGVRVTQPSYHPDVDVTLSLLPWDADAFRADLAHALTEFHERPSRDLPGALMREEGETMETWVKRLAASAGAYREAASISMLEVACDPKKPSLVRVAATAALAPATDEARAQVRVMASASADQALVRAIDAALDGHVSEKSVRELETR